jgi:hypothetical protein
LKQLLFAASFLLVISACGSSTSGGNGEGDKSASQIASDAQNCLRNSQSVHMKADLNRAGTHVAFNLDTLKSGDVSGTVTAAGFNLHLVVSGGQQFFNAGSDFWNQFNPAAAVTLADKWVQVPADSTGATEITSGVSQLTNYSALADSFTTGSGGPLTKGGVANTPDGRPAVTLNNSGGQLFVSTEGQPCPIYIKSQPGNSAGGTGFIAFTNYNASVMVTPPPAAIQVGPSSQATPTAGETPTPT